MTRIITTTIMLTLLLILLMKLTITTIITTKATNNTNRNLKKNYKDSKHSLISWQDLRKKQSSFSVTFIDRYSHCLKPFLISFRNSFKQESPSSYQEHFCRRRRSRCRTRKRRLNLLAAAPDAAPRIVWISRKNMIYLNE